MEDTVRFLATDSGALQICLMYIKMTRLCAHGDNCAQEGCGHAHNLVEVCLAPANYEDLWTTGGADRWVGQVMSDEQQWKFYDYFYQAFAHSCTCRNNALVNVFSCTSKITWGLPVGHTFMGKGPSLVVDWAALTEIRARCLGFRFGGRRHTLQALWYFLWRPMGAIVPKTGSIGSLTAHKGDLATIGRLAIPEEENNNAPLLKWTCSNASVWSLSWLTMIDTLIYAFENLLAVHNLWMNYVRCTPESVIFSW